MAHVQSTEYNWYAFLTPGETLSYMQSIVDNPLYELRQNRGEPVSELEKTIGTVNIYEKGQPIIQLGEIVPVVLEDKKAYRVIINNPVYLGRPPAPITTVDAGHKLLKALQWL